MYVTLIKTKDVSTERYAKRLEALGFHLEVIDIRADIPWTGDKVSETWLAEYAKGFFGRNGESVDVLQFLIDDWQGRSSLLGLQYGRIFSGYQTCIVQNRDDWEDTAEHELLHAANDIVRIYLGISLSRLFGVRSFDDAVVHGDDPGFAEYHYNKVWTKIAPQLTAAVQKRKRLGYLSALERLKVKLRELKQRLLARVRRITIPEENRLYGAAAAALGTDASPSDLAPDELGCAETVSTIIHGVLPRFSIITGTWTLWDALRRSAHFEQVDDPRPGDVIICPTGSVADAPYPGHAGIMAKHKRIMSNRSATGKFEENYDLAAWRVRYVQKGGYPVYFYRLKQ